MTFKDKINMVTSEFKQAIEAKYNGCSIVLFGSVARGDYSSSSDFDFMVLLSGTSNREIEEDIYNIAYELELSHDCTIDVIIFSKDTNIAIPVYQNVLKEGVAI